MGAPETVFRPELRKNARVVKVIVCDTGSVTEAKLLMSGNYIILHSDFVDIVVYQIARIL